MGERLQEIFHGKEEWYLNNVSSGFCKVAQVWDKKRNLKISETPKMIGKVETDTIKRERRKTLSMIAVIKVEVTTNITHINPQQTNLLKMIKTNDLY